MKDLAAHNIHYVKLAGQTAFRHILNCSTSRALIYTNSIERTFVIYRMFVRCMPMRQPACPCTSIEQVFGGTPPSGCPLLHSNVIHPSHKIPTYISRGLPLSPCYDAHLPHNLHSPLIRPTPPLRHFLFSAPDNFSFPFRHPTTRSAADPHAAVRGPEPRSGSAEGRQRTDVPHRQGGDPCKWSPRQSDGRSTPTGTDRRRQPENRPEGVL